MDIVALITLCKTAQTGGIQLMEAYKKRKFSDAEKELLIAAAQEGEFHLISVDGGDWIRVGRLNFPPDPTVDPLIVAEYQEAFESLCSRGFVDYDSGHLFKLTVAGFKKARSLANQ